jgi:hypothetical protein
LTLQVVRWFGHMDDADERWKMNVEKVVRQVGLGILRQYKVGFGERVFFFPPSNHPSFDPNFVSCWYLLSERHDIGGRVHEKMEYRRRRYFHFQHIPQATHSKYLLPSFSFGALYNGRRNRETTSAHLLHFSPRTR